MSTTLSLESLELPAQERMGLAGGSLLFEAAPGWWAGPGVYGAATGRRAGLFVGGLELQRRVRLGASTQLAAGLYLGGGGGGAAPVGDGLLVRPAATLLWDLGGWQAGLALSGARFAGTQVGGTQLAFVLAWDGRYRHAASGQAGRLLPDARGSGLDFEELQLAVSRWSLRDGSGREAGLASARLTRPLRPGSAWSVGAEMGAAATGGFAGYMEVLGSLGLSQPLGPDRDWHVGGRLSLGLGGGGGLSDGGGGLAKAAAFASWQALPGWSLGLEAGVVRPASGTRPRARSVQAWVSRSLQPAAARPGATAPGRLVDLEWTVGVQRMQRAARRDGRPSGPIDLVTGKLDRQLSPHLYLSAQAHSAFGGDAGAFSTGLLGAGVATSAQARPWRVGFEALAGAAGGAAVSTGGGAIGQLLAWGSWTTGAASHLRAGFGRVRALQSGGALDSPVLELSYSRRFALGAR